MKNVNGVQCELSAADIAQAAIDAAAWTAGAKLRDLAAVDEGCGMPRWQRDLVIAALPANHPQRVKAAAAEATAASIRSQP